MLPFNLLILVLALLGGLVFLSMLYLLIIRPSRLRCQSWMFYKVRDDFIGLIRDDKLAVESPVFQVFYPAVNAYIRETHPLSLGKLVTSVLRTNREAQARATEIRRQIEDSSSDVKEVLSDLFDATLYALVDNSLLLRLLVVAKALLQPLAKPMIRKDIDPSKNSTKYEAWASTEGLKIKFAA